MNVCMEIEPGVFRAMPYSRVRFDAFRIVELAPGKSRTYPVSIAGYLLPTLEAARDAALLGQAFAHKDHLLIRETDDDGTRCHLFAIKRKSTPRYEYRDHAMQRRHDLYAAPVCTIDGDVLSHQRAERIQGPEAGTETASGTGL